MTSLGGLTKRRMVSLWTVAVFSEPSWLTGSVFRLIDIQVVLPIYDKVSGVGYSLRKLLTREYINGTH